MFVSCSTEIPSANLNSGPFEFTIIDDEFEETVVGDGVSLTPCFMDAIYKTYSKDDRNLGCNIIRAIQYWANKYKMGKVGWLVDWLKTGDKQYGRYEKSIEKYIALL